MAITGAIGIIADDLTGANDTALQFFMKGSNSEIIFEANEELQNHLNVGTWALTTESRNKDPMTSAKKVYENAKKIKEILSPESYYKKIDSTLRGNIAFEVLAMLEAIEYDAAIIAPAFIQEGRMTIGGYQLLKGVPIERTDAARDTYAPIYDSYIPDILKKQLNENMHDIISTIELKTVAKGALLITNKINELVQNGKKLIIVDAVSSIDLEQIVLAIEKSQFKILPVGSAGLASALSNVWLPDIEREVINKQFPILPKLILSGSKNSITTSQINKLKMDDEIDNTYFIDLNIDDILKPDVENMAKRIVQNLGKNNIVVVHVSKLDELLKEDVNSEKLIDEGITRECFANKITDYIASVARETNKLASYVLITIGGETSYKCTKEINCGYLQVVDGILPAISLCMDSNAKFIVTKSGNMGNVNALIDIIKYFKNHEKE